MSLSRVRARRADPPRDAKRYFAVMEFDSDSCNYVSHHVVASDMAHALRVVGEFDVSGAFEIEISEITHDIARAVATSDDEAQHEGRTPRLKLAEWPVGTFLSELY